MLSGQVAHEMNEQVFAFLTFEATRSAVGQTYTKHFDFFAVMRHMQLSECLKQ